MLQVLRIACTCVKRKECWKVNDRSFKNHLWKINSSVPDAVTSHNIDEVRKCTHFEIRTEFLDTIMMSFVFEGFI
jgi:hypothetical protein